jgi:hypothetical protein
VLIRYKTSRRLHKGLAKADRLRARWAWEVYAVTATTALSASHDASSTGSANLGIFSPANTIRAACENPTSKDRDADSVDPDSLALKEQSRWLTRKGDRG